MGMSTLLYTTVYFSRDVSRYVSTYIHLDDMVSSDTRAEQQHHGDSSGSKATYTVVDYKHKATDRSTMDGSGYRVIPRADVAALVALLQSRSNLMND